MSSIEREGGRVVGEELTGEKANHTNRVFTGSKLLDVCYCAQRN